MEVDPARYDGSVYDLMTSTVIPRPIGWASSLDPNGVRNLAPFSFFNVVSGDPPMVISVGRRQFVVYNPEAAF